MRAEERRGEVSNFFYYFDRCRPWSTSLTLSTRHNMSELEASNPSATSNSLEKGNEASPNMIYELS